MAELTDAIMPILQRIQADVAGVKSDVAELKSDVAELKSDVAELKSDVAEVKSDVAEVKRDLAETKRELGGRMDALYEVMGAMSNRMEAFEDYFIYTMGLTQQNTADIKRMRSEIDAINSRPPENPR